MTDYSSYRIVFFDGVCNLCSSSVQFMIRNDPKGKFHYAPLQSELAEKLLKDLPDNPDSVILLDRGKVYHRSAAALRIAGALRGLYPLLQAYYIVPTPLRDLIYDWVAARRYKWFGKKESCMVPTPEIRDRFLDMA